jgi:hypothetical protein
MTRETDSLNTVERIWGGLLEDFAEAVCEILFRSVEVGPRSQRICPSSFSMGPVRASLFRAAGQFS